MGIFKSVYAQKLDEKLRILESKGATQDVIDFLKSVKPNELHLYITNVNNNPKITLEELKNSTIKSKEKKLSALEKSINNDFAEHKEFVNWCLYQLKKIRTTNTDENSAAGNLNDQQLKEQFNQIYDWYKSVKRDNPNWQLNNLSYSEALEEQYDWHQMMSGKGSSSFYLPFKRNENGEIVDPSIVYRFDDGWFVVKVLNENDLKVEGNRMHHCVGGYCYEVEQRLSHIYSLRDPFNKPHATIELSRDDKTIKQIKGFNNSRPDEKEKIGEFLNEHGAEWASYDAEEPDVEWYGDPENIKYAIEQTAYGVGADYFDYLDDEDFSVNNDDYHPDYGINGIGLNYHPPRIEDVDIRDCYENSLDALKHQRTDGRFIRGSWSDSKYFEFDDSMFDIIETLVEIAIEADKKILSELIEKSKNLDFNENFKKWKKSSKIDDLIFEAEENLDELDFSNLKNALNENEMPYTFNYYLLKEIKTKVENDSEYMALLKKYTNHARLIIKIIDDNLNIIDFNRDHPRLFYHENDPNHLLKDKEGNFRYREFHPDNGNHGWKYPIAKIKKVLTKCAHLDLNGKYFESDSILKDFIKKL